MGTFQMFEIFLTILYYFIVAKYFRYFMFFQKSYFQENWRFAVSSSLGFLNVCKFKESKNFAQLLVGKPSLPKFHMI